MMTCIAVDDEPLGLSLIERYAEGHAKINLLKTFTDISLVNDFLLSNPVNLLFLDIQMPVMNGMDFYKQYGQDRLVVFTTAYSEYALEGFDVKAVDFLLKPYDKGRFDLAIDRALKVFDARRTENEKTPAYLQIKSEYKIINIAIDKIVYVESKDDYVKIHLSDGKFIMSKMTTKGIQDKLPEAIFMRVHRSYIVNKYYVRNVSAKSLMIDSLVLPIGNLYKKDITDKMLALK